MRFYLLFIFISCLAQEQIFVPPIKKFDIRDYQAGVENWSVVSDTNQIMYFANSEGVLEYDGISWKLIKTLKGYGVRNLSLGKKNIIYVAADYDFGFLATDIQGKKKYVSLLNVCPDHYKQKIKQVWKVCVTTNYIYFLTNNFVIVVDHNHQFVKIINAPIYLRTLFNIDNELYAYSNEQGILKLDPKKLVFNVICNDNIILQQSIEFIDAHPKGGIRIHLFGKGFYQLINGKLILEQKSINTFLGKEYLFCNYSNDKYLYCGTTTKGFCVLNKNTLEYSGIYNKSIGLIDDKIFAIYEDIYKNLWICHENGISYVEFNSSLSHVNEQIGMVGQGSCAIKFQDKYFWGTSHGLFVTDPKVDFKFTPNVHNFNDVRQPIYFLEKCDSDLIIGCHLNLFKYDGTKFETLLNKKQSFCIKKIPNKNHEFIIGTNTGLYYYSCKGGVNNLYNIKGCDYEVNQLEFENDSICFVIDQNNRVNKLKLKYTNKYNVHQLKLLDNNRYYKLVKFQNKLVVTSNKGIFIIKDEPKNDKDLFIQLGNSNSVSVIANINEQQLWVEESYFLKGKQHYEIIVFNKNFKRDILSNNLGTYLNENKFFCFSTLNDTTIVLGVTNGFWIYKTNKKFTKSFLPKAFIRKVELQTSSQKVYFEGIKFGKTDLGLQTICGEEVQFLISSSIPNYSSFSNVMYSYKIEGIDSEWSSWSKDPSMSKVLNKYGNFVCKIKGRVDGLELSENQTSFQFVIEKPWYQTYWWYALEILILIFIVLISSYFNKNGNPTISKISAFVIVLIILTIFETTSEIIQDWLNASGITVFALKIAINIIIALSINPIENWLKYKLITKPIR
ncbi:MAG: triple tyrosine motif-containing protein [Cytophagales bacterium]